MQLVNMPKNNNSKLCPIGALVKSRIINGRCYQYNLIRNLRLLKEYAASTDAHKAPLRACECGLVK